MHIMKVQSDEIMRIQYTILTSCYEELRKVIRFYGWTSAPRLYSIDEPQRIGTGLLNVDAP